MKTASLLAALALVLCPRADAQYDPAPLLDIAGAQGAWQGTLTYDDYSEPGKLVTLPTKLFVAMSAPTELVLNYVFDDGPGKTVYSYERMRFDMSDNEVTWSSGIAKSAKTKARIVSNTLEDGARRMVFESGPKAGFERYTLELSDTSMTLVKEEIEGAGSPQFRNRYEFRRAGTEE